ncbi:hypothetical protein [Amycolatopsis sp. 195334CR]|uniref:hypothetical protein n=1 Tax=Amycolatopsis sp. 195334CR TaxID=2814588 RepID=UPI001A8FD86A|nr:hypothetical protein [Amycolatopsis sp. 195334CR]MBN6037722.1 hypothetical protein [Amycolatopsis sp. 195334CR]
MKYDRTALFAAGFAALTLLTACGGDDKAAAPPAAPAPAESAAPAAESTAPSAAPTGAAGSAEVTAPGTELKVGDRAVVPFKYGTDKTGTVAITVNSIDLGSNADLASFGDKAKGMIPVYIKMTVENVGGTDLSYSSVRLRAVGPDGRGTGVIITGETPQCKSESAKKDFTTAGAKYETCELQAIREGGEVGGATYTDDAEYKDDVITWKK